MSRNVVLVTIDSLRADHCGFMGGPDLTPTFDSLAEDGVVFENAVAPGPRTPSSMPEVFTGEAFGPTPPVESWDLDHRKARISAHLDRYRTIAARMRARGYETVGITANPWTQYLPDTDYGEGFDRLLTLNGSDLGGDGRVETGPVFETVDTVLGATGLDDRTNWRWIKDWFVQWPRIYDLVQSELDSLSEPYFFWLFLLDTHEPYLAPSEYRVENGTPEMYYAVLRDFMNSDGDEVPQSSVNDRLQRAYRDTVRSFDGFLDRFVSDCLDDQYLVVHSDHGEAFGEHGTWGHKPALYRENLEVPLVIGNTEVSDTVRKPFSLRRIPELIERLAEDGAAPDLEGLTDEFALASTEDGTVRSLTGQRWKYIDNEGDAELYDLAADPGEATNLADEYHSLTEQFDRLLGARAVDAEEKRAITDGVAELGEV